MTEPQDEPPVRHAISRLLRGKRPVRHTHQVGLRPERGWSRRNLRYIRRALLPAIFSRRSGATQSLDRRPLAFGETAITWIGHATFLIQAQGVNILVDPNWALWLGLIKRVRQPGLSLASLPPIDLVLVSHAHHDHLQIRSLRKIAIQQPILVPRGCGSLVRRHGFGSVHEMAYWESQTTTTASGETIETTFVPAAHWGARMIHDTYRQFGGYVIKVGGRTIYHAGDTAWFDRFPEIRERTASASRIDVALLPIGAYETPSGRDVHLNPEEALRAFQQLGASKMIPMHYGTFPLGNEPIGEPIERLLRGAETLGIAQDVLVPTEGIPELFDAPEK